jgi:hypothetical protein
MISPPLTTAAALKDGAFFPTNVAILLFIFWLLINF